MAHPLISRINEIEIYDTHSAGYRLGYRAAVDPDEYRYPEYLTNDPDFQQGFEDGVSDLEQYRLDTTL